MDKKISLVAAVIFLAAGFAHGESPPRFPVSSVWNQNISGAAVHPDSTTMIATLAGLGGFGNGRMQIDFSLHVVHAPLGSPTRTTVSHPWGYYDPDCEPLGAAVPVPAWAAIEGETGMQCNNLDNDCHLLVVQGDTLYEAYLVTAGERHRDRDPLPRRLAPRRRLPAGRTRRSLHQRRCRGVPHGGAGLQRRRDPGLAGQ